METEEISREYCAKLREKTQLLDSYAMATEKIKGTIECDDIQRTALYVEERERVISRIARIDDEIERFKQLDTFSIESWSRKAKDSVRKFLDEIKTSLGRLADMDKQCLALAQAEHDSMRSGILKLRQGFQLARGYGRTGVKNPRFLDLKR
jgi:hypothetical protein